MSLVIPQRGLDEWMAELIAECYASKEQRNSLLKMYRSYYYCGTSDGSVAVYNRCYPHIERLGAYLFSPADVRFHVEYDLSEGEVGEAMSEAAARKLNHMFHTKNLDVDFSSAVVGALIDGCQILKAVKTEDGIEGHVVRPGFFGVLREDISELDRQEAFVMSTYMTPTAFRRSIMEHPERDRIMDEVKSKSEGEKAEEEIEQDYFHQIVVGGTQPVSTTTPSGSGMVGIVGVPSPVLDPKIARSLIRVDELWVQDRERNDWTTLRMVKPGIVFEGNDKRRNANGITDFISKNSDWRGFQPFTKVSPNETPGYFWGNSEIAAIYRLQDDLNEQYRNMTRLRRLIADPPRTAVGFAGLNLEKYKAFNRPRGFIAEENPNAKMEDHAPTIPEELFVWFDKNMQFFDDVAGFTPVMQGQGEEGVRSQQQAAMLNRNASPRMRDRALLVERQCAEWGEFCFRLMQAMDADVQKEKGVEFMLSQLGRDIKVAVDSHSSSPVYQQDNLQLAFGLMKAQAIDGADLIMLTHPQHEDILYARAKAREAAQAKLLQEHPELLTKGKGHK